MQKNLYDYSTLIWSPQGRLFQVEYAMEAVNQGNLVLGVKSKSNVVLCGLKSSSHDTLSYHQEKLFKVSSHMGIGVAGLTPDGSNIKLKIGLLHKFMKNETLNYNYVYNADYPVERMVTRISESKSFGITFRKPN
jgi:20S proteasome subunit alpha 6